MFISLLIFESANKQHTPPGIEIGKCVSTCGVSEAGGTPRLAKAHVKWHKIKYPVVKVRFSDKCDAHVTEGSTNK